MKGRGDKGRNNMCVQSGRIEKGKRRGGKDSMRGWEKGGR